MGAVTLPSKRDHLCPLANRTEKDAAGHLNDPMTSIEARPVGFKELFRFIWKTITLSLPSRAVEPLGSASEPLHMLPHP